MTVALSVPDAVVGVEPTRVDDVNSLAAFRCSFYDCLGSRSDALFELTDAVLCCEGPVTTLVGGVTSPTGAGTPQGSPTSPLMANVALHVLDEAWQHEGCRLGTLVRYCDDFVVLSPTRQRAEQARELAARVLGRLGMRLHPDKSGIACLTKGGQGFDFLGFHHRKVESWRWRGRFYLQRWPSVRAMRVLRDKVRAATHRSQATRPVSAVVADINPILKGWGAYFRNGNSGRKFNAVDGYVNERLAIMASWKYGLAGRNWGTRFTYGWVTRLGGYRLTGTVRRATVHAKR
ncbi:group II intron maturase-specific domain-containing protein [Nocardia sp. NPDC004278]